MKLKFQGLAGLLFYCLHLEATIPAFTASSTGGTIYLFDASNTSIPATAVITNPSLFPDGITSSPDGSMIYFTNFFPGGDVYSFPAAGPYVANPLNTGISWTQGIAISSDGQTGYATQNTSAPTPAMAGIYSFPIAGGSSQLLSPATTSIDFPLMLAISGDNAFVSRVNYTGGPYVYSLTFDNVAHTYSATPLTFTLVPLLDPPT